MDKAVCPNTSRKRLGAAFLAFADFPAIDHHVLLYETPVGGLVELTADGRLNLPGTRFLAGSVVPLKDAVGHLATTYLSLSESLRLARE
jgi:hypothetical protein